jgi:Mrp family chromosome partitioning ATPase
MVNLTAEMAQLWASLGAPQPGRGRVVQFAAAARGEGVSTIAREFARFAAGRASRPVWLVDLDLASDGQFAAISAEPGRYGPIGRAAAASPDGSAFFAIQPTGRDPRGRLTPDSHYFCASPVGGGRLWVVRMRRERLAPGQSAQLAPSADYWNALRRHAELVVIDAPAADRSQAAVSMAPFVDLTVLVVAAEGHDTRGPAALRDAIEQTGGRCAGIVFNRARIEPPKFLRALMP